MMKIAAHSSFSCKAIVPVRAQSKNVLFFDFDFESQMAIALYAFYETVLVQSAARGKYSNLFVSKFY